MARPFHNHKRRGYRSNSFVRHLRGFGKFDGENVTTIFAYDMAMESTDICSHGDGGSSVALVEGPFRAFDLLQWRGEFEVARDRVCGTNDRLNRAERRFIKQMAGCIVHKSGDGFVSVHWYKTAKGLDDQWASVIAEYTPDEDDDGDDSSESEENNYVKGEYVNGECPDCRENIPDDAVDGDECENCGHVFGVSRPNDD